MEKRIWKKDIALIIIVLLFGVTIVPTAEMLNPLKSGKVQMGTYKWEGSGNYAEKQQEHIQVEVTGNFGVIQMALATPAECGKVTFLHELSESDMEWNITFGGNTHFA